MGTIIRQNIMKNIAYYRKLNGYTQKELATILGVKNSSVSNWEQGANAPDIETIFELCKLFKISVSDMFGCDVIDGDSIRISGIEKDVILAYRSSENLEKEMVHKILNIPYTKDSKGDSATTTKYGTTKKII